MYLTEEQIDALHFTWPDRWIIVRDTDGFCTFAGDIPSEEEIAEAEKSEVYIKYLIVEKIDGLEAEITSRRVRDALSGSEEARLWLDEQEEKIQAERAKLAAMAQGAPASDFEPDPSNPSVPEADPSAPSVPSVPAAFSVGEEDLPPNSLDAAVRIMLMAVYTDGKRSESEMAELERQGTVVGGAVTFSEASPLRAVADVVDDRILAVRAVMEGPERDAAVERALRAIDDPELIEKLAQAIVAIFGSDLDFDVAESQFLAQARDVWKIGD